MNEEYKRFQGLWTTFNEHDILLGVIFCGLLTITTIFHSSARPLSLAFITGRATVALGLYHSDHHFFLLTVIVATLIYQMSTAKLPQVSLCLPTLIALVAYIDMSFSDSLLQEGDYLIDALVILLSLTAWAAQRKEALIPLIVIISCTKLAYFCDREASLNF